MATERPDVPEIADLIGEAVFADIKRNHAFPVPPSPFGGEIGQLVGARPRDVGEAAVAALRDAGKVIVDAEDADLAAIALADWIMIAERAGSPAKSGRAALARLRAALAATEEESRNG